MKKYLCFLSLLFFASICKSCQKESNPVVANTVIDTIIFNAPAAAPLNSPVFETSGIADSKANPGYLWLQQDSGNPPELILLSHSGNLYKRIKIENAINRDWEDMVLAGNQVYIGDIGDNNLVYTEYSFIQFTEPDSSANTVNEYKTIRFKYPDGAHDAEAFLVDPQKKDIYIITKRDNPSKVYKLTYPQSYSGINTATYLGTLPYSGVVSAALSPSGKYIIVKTYMGLHLYAKKTTQDIFTAISGRYTDPSYQLEPQGEAVTFALDNSGIYTLSEKGLANSVKLYFYQAK